MRLAFKIRISRKNYNDSLPFTELSKESAGRYGDQYNNVYLKGALISCCLDIYLLHLSNGKYGLHNLIEDLSKKYGAKKPFNDAMLFDEIGSMTYPEIRKFFTDYVESPMPIPYEYFFNLAGVRYMHERKDGDIIELPNEKKNTKDSILVKTPVKQSSKLLDNLEFADNATDHQIMIRNAWLGSMATKESSTK